jgi:hypothetical protein
MIAMEITRAHYPVSTRTVDAVFAAVSARADERGIAQVVPGLIADDIGRGTDLVRNALRVLVDDRRLVCLVAGVGSAPSVYRVPVDRSATAA